MYRILLVDDERHVLDWISELLGELDGHELDVYKAETVTEALAWLNRCRVDIVVSDIAMPGMTGLELHGKIRERWPECKVIFLTGYTDFEFAYQAVKNEAVGYILKTEDDDVIVETVRKAIVQIEESERKERLVRQAEERVKAAIPMLRNEGLAALLRGEPGTFEDREAMFRDLEIALDPGKPVMAAVSRLDERRQEGGDGTQTSRVSALRFAVACVCDTLEGRNAKLAHATVDGDLVWLVQFDSGAGLEEPVSSKLLMETLDEAHTVCRESLGQSLSTVMAEGGVSWAELALRYPKLQQGLVRQMLYASGFIMLEGGLADRGRESSEEGISVANVPIERNRWDALRADLEKGNRERFMRGLEEIEQLTRRGQLSLQDSAGLEAFGHLSLLLLSAMNRWEMRELSSDASLVGKLASAERHSSLQEAFSFVREKADAIFDRLGEKREHGEYKVIEYVREYISQHLHKGISLVELAEAVYFNPSYLSRLFKEATGRSVTAYLADLRLERAVAMLRENCKIGDIAAAVGIDSPAYFSRFFKKMTGRTPQEYREEFILGNRS
ncbi:response regulator [Cohnella sp. LGH]|uniref:response regulator transcription factor n=1 Tax=Cohnella sp. LGH TaxID=1619153 RepID=UPI001ADC44D0|nr:helix-turn-helix domain-containing protein [Cohnella sp. LGH]QTH43414.1 response regulator [Cohnella sp. LGH]